LSRVLLPPFNALGGNYDASGHHLSTPAVEFDLGRLRKMQLLRISEATAAFPCGKLCG
jgi:hypothetical protein